MRPSIFTDVAQAAKRLDVSATVLRTYGAYVDVRTASGSVLPRLSLIGAAFPGDIVTVKYQEGIYVAYGGKFRDAASQSGVAIINGSEGGGGGVGAGAPNPHALSSSYHTGTLGYVQLPTLNVVAGALLSGGGNMAVSGAINIAIDTTKLDVTGGKLIKAGAGTLTLDAGGAYTLTIPATGTAALGAGTLTVATINSSAGANHTHAVTSSSYPGATNQLLSTDASGYLGVVRFGIGAAASGSHALYSVTASPSLFSGQVESAAASATPQFKATYNASNYAILGTGSAGSFTIGSVGGTMANAHIYFNPGGGSANVAIGNSVPTPTSKLEINSTGEHLKLAYSGSVYWTNTVASGGDWTMTPTPSGGDLVVAADVGIGGAVPGGLSEQLGVYYDSANYATMGVSSTGVFTFSGFGTTAANAHALFNPGGKMGVNMTGTPAAQLEVRRNSGAQLRASYDTTAYLDVTVSSGGNATLTTYGSDLTFNLQPSGGTAGAKYLMPGAGYDVNIGRLTKKYLSLHAAELVVETLVAFDTQATIGGRLLITPSTTITSDFLASGATSTIAHTGTDSTAVTVGSTSWVVSVNGGVSTGDLVVVVLSMQATATITPPAGFTLVTGSQQDWTGGRRTATYYKIRAGGDGGSYTFTLGTSTAGAWVCSGFSGVDSVTPISAQAFQQNTGTTNHVAPTVTPATSADMLLYVGGYNNSSATMTAPAGMSERADTAYAAGFNTVYLASQLLSSSAATGTRTGTTAGSHDSNFGLIALRPASSGVPTTMLSKYNNLTVGDIVRFEGNGLVEFMSVASGPTGTGPYSYVMSRNLDGTGANNWYAGDLAQNTGQTGAGWIDAYAWWSAKGSPIEHIFNYNGSTFSSNLTLSTGWNLWRSSGVASGDAIYFGMSGGKWANVNLYLTSNTYTAMTGVLEYWNGSGWATLSGAQTTYYNATTGASSVLTVGYLPATTNTGVLTHTWTAASQTGWDLNTINGISAYWMRWRVVSATSIAAVAGYRRVMRGSVQYGPTIVGNVRNSNTFNDWSERWAIGNLHGLYDYGKITYGFAAGDYTATWVAADAENGFRIMSETANIGQWDTAGNMRIGQIINGQSRIELDSTGNFFIINRQAAVDTAVGTWDASGNLTVGAAANSKSRIYLSAAGKLSMYARSAGGVDVERFYVDTAGNLRLIGDASNYVNVNGATGVVTVSGVINVIAGSTVPVATVTGLGALATLNTVAWGSQVTGRPIDNLGALVTAAAPSGAGLYLGSTFMGYYSGAKWVTYINNSGQFVFRGAPSASVNVGAVIWNGTQLVGGYYPPVAGPDYGTFAPQWYSDSLSGAIMAGGGAVELGLNGVQIGWGSHLGFGAPTVANANSARAAVQAYYPNNTPGEVPTVQFSLERGTFGANLTNDLQSGIWSFTQSTADTTQLGITSPINVTAGATYEASTWAQFATISYTGTPDTQFEIRINWYAAGAAYLSSSSSVFYSPSASDTLPRSVRVSGTAPASTVTARIEFRKRGIGSGGTSSHQVTYARTAFISYSLGSYINMKPSEIQVGNLNVAGKVTSALGVYVGSYSRAMPLHVGDIAESYAPTLTKWTNNDRTYANIVLSGLDYTAIAFHDSSTRVDGITAGAGVITIGGDFGYGAARVDFGDVIGTVWADVTFATNWAHYVVVNGGGWDRVQYKKIGDVVLLRGLVLRQTSNAASGTVITTLPAGYRPSGSKNFTVWANTSTGQIAIRLTVESGGNVYCNGPQINTNGWVSFDGVILSTAT